MKSSLALFSFFFFSLSYAKAHVSTQKFVTLKAQQSWLRTGIVVREGDGIYASGVGTWRIASQMTEVGVSGDSLNMLQGCPLGSLIGRIGLSRQPFCLGYEAWATAPFEGVLFIQINDFNLNDNEGELDVGLSVASLAIPNDYSPSVRHQNLGEYALKNLRVPTVEIRSQHYRMEVDRVTLWSQRRGARKSLDILDRIFTHHKELVGGFRPTPDTTQVLTPNLDEQKQLWRIHDDSTAATDMAKNLAFTFLQINQGAFAFTPALQEAFARVMAITFAEANSFYFEHLTECSGKELTLHFTRGTRTRLATSPRVATCFLLEFKELYGQKFFQKFFTWYNNLPETEVFQSQQLILRDHRMAFNWLQDAFNQAAEEDTRPTFRRYKHRRY